MKWIIVVAAAVPALIVQPAEPPAAAELELSVNRLYQKESYSDPEGYPVAIVTATNTSTRSYSLIVIQCAFMLNGRTVIVGKGTIANLGVGQSGVDEVFGSSNGRVDSVTCRISDWFP